MSVSVNQLLKEAYKNKIFMNIVNLYAYPGDNVRYCLFFEKYVIWFYLLHTGSLFYRLI